MKKLLLLILFVILSISFVSAGGSGASSQIRVNLLSQEPDPVQPREIVEVRFKIENLGAETTDDIIIEVMPDYPFSLYTGEPKREIGKLRAGQTGADSVIVDYKLKVDKVAVEGENEIELRIKIGDDVWQTYTKDQFLIDIRTRDAVLAVEEVRISSQTIAPGEKSKVFIKLRNTADSLIRDIKVKLDLSSSDLPFAPIGSTTEKRVYQLDSEEEIELFFDIEAMANADSKLYKVPLIISYFDERGTSYNKNEIIGLKVGDEPELFVEIKSNEIYSRRGSGNIILNFINSGLIDIKSLNVKLAKSNDYEILSYDSVYVGDVDVDDDETAEFRLKIKGVNDAILPLSVNYRDANNNEYDQIFNIELQIYSAKEMGVSKDGFGGYALIVLIVILILYAFFYTTYRRWRKNEEEGMIDYLSYLIERYIFRAKK